MEYIVVFGDSKLEFEKDVASYLRQGWELVGGVSISQWQNYSIKYAQALVKRIDQ
jgi:hypothetical protein